MPFFHCIRPKGLKTDLTLLQSCPIHRNRRIQGIGHRCASQVATFDGEDGVDEEFHVVHAQHVRLFGLHIAAQVGALVFLAQGAGIALVVPVPAQPQFVERRVERIPLRRGAGKRCDVDVYR